MSWVKVYLTLIMGLVGYYIGWMACEDYHRKRRRRGLK